MSKFCTTTVDQCTRHFGPPFWRIEGWSPAKEKNAEQKTATDSATHTSYSASLPAAARALLVPPHFARLRKRHAGGDSTRAMPKETNTLTQAPPTTATVEETTATPPVHPTLLLIGNHSQRTLGNHHPSLSPPPDTHTRQTPTTRESSVEALFHEQ